MDIRKISPHLLKTSKKKKDTSSKVGQAVYDILQKGGPAPTVQEIIDEYQHKYAQEMEDTINNNFKKYESPFYIVVLTKKEPWALNVMRSWFIARQTRPKAKFLRDEFPTFMQTVYSIDKSSHELKILWSLPIKQDADVVLKNRHLYDPQLVKWVDDYNSGALDQST